MGTWGIKNFENDEAMDFVALIAEKNISISELHSVIRSASDIHTKDDPDYGPDAYDATRALVAIEYLAALRGKPSEDFPLTGAEWIARTKHLNNGASAIEDCKQAITQIKTNSELKELWEESGEQEEWFQIMDELKNRIE